ncbi:MAG: hypothetical protein QOD99_791, partial [Chthoniobacter sp.]|nr:hypothetical protein [Chthoniobacter sp.]
MNFESAETARLAALAAYDILDSPREQEYDDIARLAAQICGTPVALVSLIAADRQWFKAAVGTDLSETPLDISFCAHAIRQSGQMLIIPDAIADPRFETNALVTGEPFIRFYVGAPLLSREGQPLGTLCVLDTEPRELTPDQLASLQALSRQVMTLLELRRSLRELSKTTEEHDRAAAALAKSEQRLQLALAAAKLGTWQHDLPDGELLWNDTAREQFGVSKDDRVTSEMFYSMLHPDDRDSIDQAVKTALTERENCEVEYRIQHPDGTLKWMRSAGVGAYDADGVATRFDGVVMDITEQKLAEETMRAALEHMAEASRAKDQFFAVLSHELRTPLTPATALLPELEADPRLPDDVREDLALIRRSVETEARLIDDLLDMTRIA